MSAFDDGGEWVPFPDRPRPDADLLEVQLKLGGLPGNRRESRVWRHIEIGHDDEAALGRIFAWLMGQVMDAKASSE